MSNSKKIAYNTIVQVISRILTAGMSLVIIGYLTRYLDVVGWGQYNLIFAYLGLFGVVVDFGFFLLQVRDVVRNPGSEGKILGNILALKLVLSVVVFAAAYIVSLLVYDNPIISTGILLGAVSQASISLLHIPNSLFQARLQMHVVAIANIVARLTYGGVVIWAVLSDWGLLNIVALISAVNLATLIVMLFVANRSIKIRLGWDWGYIKKFVLEALPIGATTVLAMIYFRVDTVMLGYLANDYAVGIYSTPYKILDVILTIPVIFMSSVFPIMTQAIAQGREHLQRIFAKAFDYSVMAAAPIVVGAFLLAGPIIRILAGSGFEESVPVLKILIWVTALSFLGAVLNYTMIANGKQKLLVWPYLAATVFNVVANSIFIPKYSYFGAAYTTIITELIVIVWAGWILATHLKLLPSGFVWFKSIVSAGVMGVAIWLLGSSHFILIALVAAAVYVTMLLLFKIFPLGTLKQLLNRQ